MHWREVLAAHRCKVKIPTAIRLSCSSLLAGKDRCSRNPIYVSFVLLSSECPSGWSWLVITLGPAGGCIAAAVLPREEQCLEHNFRSAVGRKCDRGKN